MYSFSSRVRYSEVTKERTLDLYAIINYFQDCSNFHSVDLGVGVEELTARHRAWLLSSWQIELVNVPRLFDKITIGTWPYEFKGAYGYRNFILYNESRGHETAAYANSIWFLIDSETGRPQRITPEECAAYTLEPPYPMEYAPRKITLPETVSLTGSDAAAKALYRTAPCPPLTVTHMLLDTNNHVNNGQYVRLAESCLPEGFALHGMRAEYRRAAVLGDVIEPLLYFSPSAGDCFVSLNTPDGQPYAVVQFY